MHWKLPTVQRGASIFLLDRKIGSSAHFESWLLLLKEVVNQSQFYLFVLIWSLHWFFLMGLFIIILYPLITIDKQIFVAWQVGAAATISKDMINLLITLYASFWLFFIAILLVSTLRDSSNKSRPSANQDPIYQYVHIKSQLVFLAMLRIIWTRCFSIWLIVYVSSFNGMTVFRQGCWFGGHG